MKRKLLLTFLALLHIGLMLVTAQNTTAVVSGVVRVKLTRDAATRIEAKAGSAGLIVASSVTPFSTGITTLDAVCRQLNATEMVRVFPYSKKFDARHKKAGLDLWYELKIDQSAQPLSAVKALNLDASILFAEPVLKVKLYANEPTNDPHLAKQWHYNNTGQTGGRVGADINLFEAWKKTMGSDKVIVAIIDGGFEQTHSDLKNNRWINKAELNGTPGIDDDGNGYIDDVYGWDFVNNSPNISAHYHGTHVAGTVGAENNNGIGVAGVAGGTGNGDGVRLMSCQVFTTTSSGNFARPFVYAADNGAVIAQNSWGYETVGVYEKVVHDAIDYFIKYAGKDENDNPLPNTTMNGGIVFFAAGNDASSGQYYPGCYDKVYAVSALNQYNRLASYSNYDTWVDIAAPGGEGESTQGVISTYLNNSYVGMSGTSMACPHISGVAALVLSVHGGADYTPEMLWNRLVNSSKNVDDLNPLYAGKIGVGLIDAAKAVEANDGLPPNAVNDLNVSLLAQDFADLSFTAPADPDNASAIRYELRYSVNPIVNDSTFDKLQGITPAAKEAGTAETLRIWGLTPQTKYYAAIKSRDIWGNLSNISNIIEFTTAGYPKAQVLSDTLKLIVADVKANPIVSTSLQIKNAGEGALKYNVLYAGVKDPRTLPKTFIDTISNYTNSSDYAQYVIGDDGLSDPFYAASKFVVEDAIFNLSHLKISLRTINSNSGATTQPFVLKIYKGGDTPNSGTLIYNMPIGIKQTWSGNINIPLGERIKLVKDESFWVVLEFPAEYKQPMGVNASIIDLKNQSYYSSDEGKTWATLNSLNLYQPDVAFRIFPLSEIAALDDFLTSDPETELVLSQSPLDMTLTVDAQNLVNGNYVSNVKLLTNDPTQPVVSVPVQITVKGQTPSFLSVDKVDFETTIIGKASSKDITIKNTGKGTLVIDTLYTMNNLYTVSPAKMQVLPNESAIARVTFTPTASGPVASALKLKANTQLESIVLSATGTNPPVAEITPANISATIKAGEKAVKSFTLKNTGAYQMEYAIPGFEKIAVSSVSDKKTGYTAYTSREANGPDFKWENMDAAADITQDVILGQGMGAIVDLGFKMYYYNNIYDSVTVTQGGILAMGKIQHQMNVTVDYPMPNGPGNTFSPIYAASNMLLNGGNVFYKKASGYSVIEYRHVGVPVSTGWFGDFPASGTIDVQVVLKNNGLIEYYYNNYQETEYDDNLMSWVVAGFENIDGTDGANITRFDRNFMLPGEQLGVRIIPGAPAFVKGLSSVKGLLAPGDEVEVKVSLEADKNLLDSTYVNHVFITTNDPVAETIDLPLTITVQAESKAMIVADTLEFGELGLGYSKTANVSVYNQGGKKFNVVSSGTTSGIFVSKVAENAPPVVNGFASLAYEVTFTPSALGEYNDTLTLVTDVPEISPLKVVLKGKGINASHLEVEAIENQSYTLQSGAMADTAIVVKNTGAGELEYVLSRSEWIKTPDLSASVLDGSDKSGYYWADNKTNSGVTFDWIPIDNAKVQENVMSIWGADLYDLPFEFPYYGKNYNKIIISSHGQIGFDLNNMEDIRYAMPIGLPKADNLNNIICGLRTQLFPGSNDDLTLSVVYAESFEDKAVFTWYKMYSGIFSNYIQGTTVTFQIILFKDGRIKFQYDDVEGAPWAKAESIIGIENADGSDGFCIDFFSNYIQDKLAVMITPGSKHKLASGESVRIPLTIDANGINDGSYTGKLVVAANDYTKRMNLVNVDLTVLGTPDPVLSQDSIGFGDLFVYTTSGTTFKSYNQPITLQNKGSKLAELTSVSLPANVELTGITAPLSLEPGTKVQGQLVYTPVTTGEFNDRVEFTYGGDLAGQKDAVKLTAKLIYPPVENLTSELVGNAYDVTLLPGAKDTTGFRLENIGLSSLNYQLGIEYLDKDGYNTAMGLTSVQPSVKSAPSVDTALKMLQFANVAPSAAPVTRAEQAIFADSLTYGHYQLTTLVYLTNPVTFAVASRFDVPEEGFNLTHVGNWFKNFVEGNEIEVSVLVGKSYRTAEKIHSQIIAARNNSEWASGQMEIAELTNSYHFNGGESFWVVYTHSSTEVQQATMYYGSEPIEDYFYIQVDKDVEKSSAFGLGGLPMAAYSDEKKDLESWITLLPQTGTIANGAGNDIQVNLNSANIYNGTKTTYARVYVDSNDPVERNSSFYVRMAENQAPQIVSTDNYSVNEGETLSFDVNVSDLEGDAYTVQLNDSVAQGQPRATFGETALSQYVLALSPDYQSAGDWKYIVSAEDAHGLKSEKTINVKVLDVNRVPVSKGIADTIIYTSNAPLSIALSNVFSDPDGDALTFTTENYDGIVLATQIVNANTLRVVGWSAGVSSLTVKATDPSGASVSTTFNVTVANETGISGNQAAWGVQVYPNPVTTEAKVILGEEWNGSILMEVIDLAGKTCLSKTIDADADIRLNESEVSGLANGVYQLRIKSTDKQQIVKLIKE